MPSLWERRRRVKAASSTTIDHHADNVGEVAARGDGVPGVLPVGPLVGVNQ